MLDEVSIVADAKTVAMPELKSQGSAAKLTPSRICRTCGLPISKERIAAMPTAIRHVECQTPIEGDTRQYVDEGIAGTRDGYIFMRKRNSQDMGARNSIFSL